MWAYVVARLVSLKENPASGTYVTGDSLTSMLVSVMSEDRSLVNMAFEAMEPLATTRRGKEDQTERLLKK